MRVSTLGPSGTFSHQASLSLEPRAELIFEKSIRDVFETVSAKRADKGVVPVENSVGGAVNFTLDAFLDFGLKIEAEFVLPVRHALMARAGLVREDIDRLYLHGQTFSQCENYIREKLSLPKVQEVFSNAEAARIVSGGRGREACLGPALAADIYGLEILEKNVQDSHLNVTRFFVVSMEDSLPSGCDKTSLVLCPRLDRPGLLWEILGIFKEKGLNLTKIESRPAKGRLGDYIFFIDVEGHSKDEKMAEAIREVEVTATVKVLGSYPQNY